MCALTGTSGYEPSRAAADYVLSDTARSFVGYCTATRLSFTTTALFHKREGTLPLSELPFRSTFSL